MKHKRRKTEEDFESDKMPAGAVLGTQPIEEPKAGILTKVAAVISGAGFCQKCQKPCAEDPKGVHRCARCRSETIAK